MIFRVYIGNGLSQVDCEIDGIAESTTTDLG